MINYQELLHMKLFLSGLLITWLVACSDNSSREPEPDLGTSGEVAQMTFNDQVTTGADLYATNCATCHGTNLEGSTLGPLLSGYSFVQRWGTQTPALLLGNIQANMPPGGNENISNSDYLNIVAHILRVNGVDELSEAITSTSDFEIADNIAKIILSRLIDNLGPVDIKILEGRFCNNTSTWRIVKSKFCHKKVGLVFTKFYSLRDRGTFKYDINFFISTVVF